MSGVTYDAGALIAAERRNRAVWAAHAEFQVRGIDPTVPAAVLGQVWRGGPQPMLLRFLRGCWIQPLDGPIARAAGAALASSRTTDLVDAVVVVTAAARGDLVLTSDPHHLSRIAQALGIRLDLHEV